MLIASVLAVVAGSPAHAANTSSEVLVDTNGDGTPDAREFAGRDRYDTALRLAKNFAGGKGGLGAVPVAFVASGETLVDSISVAGLAGDADAPVLLTPGNSLHGGVADFIEDYRVSTVYVLGGRVAVAEATLEAIEELSNEPTVERVYGDDRYLTAAAIASRIKSVSSWCGSTARGAVLINGATEMLPFGVAISTMAFRLRLPVLMTAADELPDSSADFIRDNDIEHVQVIGDADVVSADVVSALTTLGVDVVERVGGASASEVSVELAKLAGNGCSTQLAPLSFDRVALVRGNPDGVAAAPTLASSLANGNMVSPLIVGDTLPEAVRDYLAATPKNLGASKLDLGIVAIGGTAAVSDAVMEAATAAAAATGELTVEIAAGPDDTTTNYVNENDTNGDGVGDAKDPIRPDATAPVISLHFSDTVALESTANTTDGAVTLAKIRDILEINGVPARVTSVAGGAGANDCSTRRLDVTLAQGLRNGDTISIVESPVHKLGTGKDKRPVQPASRKVEAAPADTTRPKVSIVGIADGTETNFFVTVSDDRRLEQADPPSAAIKLSPASGAATATAGTVVYPPDVAQASGGTNSRLALFPVSKSDSSVLAVGDQLTVTEDAFKDVAVPIALKNVPASFTAIAPQASPTIRSVQMNLKHTANAVWHVRDDFARPNGTGTASTTNAVTIKAKADGDAAGAAGNSWTMLFDTAATWQAGKPADIDVRVDTTGKTVTARVVNGRATVGDLLAALSANSDFDQRFTAALACNGSGASAVSAAPNKRLDINRTARSYTAARATTNGDGSTQFAIVVSFNVWVKHIDADARAALVADILHGVETRNRGVSTLAQIKTGLQRDNTSHTRDINNLSAENGGTALTVAPLMTVRLEGQTTTARFLPKAGDVVTTLAGRATAVSTDATAGLPALGTEQEVAVGYAANSDTTRAIDESVNGYSQVTIALNPALPVRLPF
jgi:putative cell wall-binding protein